MKHHRREERCFRLARSHHYRTPCIRATQRNVLKCPDFSLLSLSNALARAHAQWIYPWMQTTSIPTIAAPTSRTISQQSHRPTLRNEGLRAKMQLPKLRSVLVSRTCAGGLVCSRSLHVRFSACASCLKVVACYGEFIVANNAIFHARACNHTDVRPAASRRKKTIVFQSYHQSLDDSIKAVNQASQLGHISTTAALQECPKIKYPQSPNVAEGLFRSLRPWHSSPVVMRPKEEAKYHRQHPQKCPYDPACNMLDDEIHLDRFTHECPQGFFCVNTDPTHRR